MLIDGDKMLHRLVASVVLVLFTLLALPAFAQDGKADGEESGASVVILKFDTFNAEQAVMDEFYRALHDAVEGHTEMHVKPGGDVSINDLILTLGCKGASAECLAGLTDFIEGDRIVFGSVQHSEDVYLFSLKMFDFASNKFIREVSEETLEGDAEAVKQGVDAVVAGFLYGNVGTLDIALNGASDADVSFDGEQIGRAPMTVKDLPLGEHAVTVQTSDGQKQSKKVMLHRGKVSKVLFNFEDVEAPSAGKPIASKSYVVPGWAATGIGTVGLVAGIIGTVQVNSFNTEAESLVCGDSLCSGASTVRANKLQDDMDSAYTMSVVGYSVAAVGLAAGTYLLYEAYGGSGAESAPAGSDMSAESSPEVNVGIAPTTGGASIGVHVGF
jgi:hypothetical protein